MKRKKYSMFPEADIRYTVNINKKHGNACRTEGERI